MKKPEQLINKKYSQNYFKSDLVIRNIINKYISSFENKNVIDIGAGRGIISKNIAKFVKKILAIEIDNKNIEQLKALNIHNLDLIKEDIRNVNLDSYFDEYTIFANIPFFLTSEILKNKVLMSQNLKEAFVFMQKEAVYRYFEKNKNLIDNSYLSVLFNTYFDIEIIYQFDKNDFFPIPSVDVVLVKFTRKNNQFDSMYFDFIAYMFNVRKSNIKNVLLEIFTYNQVKNHIQKFANFKLDQKCSELTTLQWLKIYDSYLKVNMPKAEKIKRSFNKISNYQLRQNNKVIV